MVFLNLLKVLLLTTGLLTASFAEVLYQDKVLPKARARYFYDSNQPQACQTVVILGVGTGMRTTDYNKLGTEISSSSAAVTVILDHNPYRLVKTSSRLFAAVTEHLVSNLATYIPEACASTLTDTILIGGHSASGQAAWNAVPLLRFVPDGFVGLDPFRLDPDCDSPMALPTLNFGFTQTSCQVTAGQAAKAGYQATNVEAGRVLIQTNNNADGLGHCDFADNGCYGVVCAASDRAEGIRATVGTSLASFVEGLASESSASFGKEAFQELVLQSGMEDQLTVFVNDDTVSRRTRYLRGRFHH